MHQIVCIHSFINTHSLFCFLSLPALSLFLRIFCVFIPLFIVLSLALSLSLARSLSLPSYSLFLSLCQTDVDVSYSKTSSQQKVFASVNTLNIVSTTYNSLTSTATKVKHMCIHSSYQYCVVMSMKEAYSLLFSL